MYKYIALALAGAAAALPAGGPTDNTFKTIMSVNGTFISINAVQNGTNEDLVLVGERLAAYPGTTTFQVRNFEDPGAAVVFDIDSVDYGWKVTEVDHADGNVFPLVARKDYYEFEFTVSNGTITHELTATTNEFLACDSVVNGEPATVLSWGNPNSDGTLPEGCLSTTVQQN